MFMVCSMIYMFFSCVLLKLTSSQPITTEVCNITLFITIRIVGGGGGGGGGVVGVGGGGGGGGEYNTFIEPSSCLLYPIVVIQSHLKVI